MAEPVRTRQSSCMHSSERDMVLVHAIGELCLDQGASVATGEGGLDVATWFWCRDMGRGLLGAARSRPRFQVATGWTACRASSGS